MSASHTVLESEGTGLLALGRPDDVARLIEQGRELRLAGVGLVTDGGPTECHVTVVSAQRVQLRDVDYPVVRELGQPYLDAFRVGWVEEHDSAWCQRWTDEYGITAVTAWQDDALERFDHRHAHREAWLLRFTVDRALPPRLLAERSDELYVENPARALRDELPALTEDEWKLHIAPGAKDREHARQAALIRDRAAQGTRERLARARDAAAVKGLDMRSEFRRYDRLVLHDRTGDAVRQLELIESRVFPRRVAA